MKREREIRDEFVKSGHIEHYEVLRARKREKPTDLLQAMQEVHAGKRPHNLPCNHTDLLENISWFLKKNDSFLALASTVVEKGATVILHHGTLRFGLKNLSGYLDRQVNALDQWAPPKGSFRVRFNHLLHHLYCRYPVPPFMDKLWLAHDPEDHKFYLDIANGVSVYGHPYLKDVVLSRKMAHHFRQAPANCTVLQAVRRAQVYVVRKDKRLYRAISSSFLGRRAENDGFWSKAIAWMARQEIHNYAAVRPMLCYIAYCKFGTLQVGEVAMKFAPPNPDFDLAGKTFPGLLRAMRAHFERMREEYGRKGSAWVPAPIHNHSWGMVPDGKGAKAAYTMVQLLNQRELLVEGVRMQHCVASYGNACTTGRSSIWSLRKTDQKGEHSLITVELANSNLTIVQVRGHRNRLPNAFESKLVQEWATLNKLKIVT